MANTWILASEDRRWHVQVGERSSVSCCGGVFLAIAAKHNPDTEHLECTGYEVCSKCLSGLPSIPVQTLFLAFDVLMVRTLDNRQRRALAQVAVRPTLRRRVACKLGLHVWGLTKCPACRRPDRFLRRELAGITGRMSDAQRGEMVQDARAALAQLLASDTAGALAGVLTVEELGGLS